MRTTEWRAATEHEQQYKRCQSSYCSQRVTQAETVAAERKPTSRSPGFLHTYFFCDHHAALARMCAGQTITVTDKYSHYRGQSLPVVEVKWHNTRHAPDAPPDIFCLRNAAGVVMEFYHFEVDASAWQLGKGAS